MNAHGLLRKQRPELGGTSPLLAKGFRPFFLVAAAFAAVFVPVWLLVVRGTLAPSAYLDATYWHAHEMIFGFTAAVIAGFLLTAVGNWTQRETAVGLPLLGLVALWFAGRLAMTFPSALQRGVAAVLDLAFLPTLAVVLARPLVRTGNKRNYVMIGILGALTLANLGMHLDALGLVRGVQRRASLVAIDIVILLVLVIAGRVVPMFTRNATRATSIRSVPALDAAAAASMLVVGVVDGATLPRPVLGLAATLAALFVLARSARWGAWHARKEPLLWILHAGHAWIAIGLALRAVSAFDAPVPESVALHALTIGGLGSMTLGMMTRVGLGHTGRMLVAGRLPSTAFVLVLLAALARVVLPLVAPSTYSDSLSAAGLLWSGGFVLYLVAHARLLASPRVDGKPG